MASVFAKEGMTVALAARNTDKLKPLCDDTGARVKGLISELRPWVENF